MQITEAQRDALDRWVRRDGEVAVAECVGLSRLTIARAAAGWPLTRISFWKVLDALRAREPAAA